MPAAGFGTFVAQIPPPLGIGTLALEDGEQVKGFVCEIEKAIGLAGSRGAQPRGHGGGELSPARNERRLLSSVWRVVKKVCANRTRLERFVSDSR